MLGLRLLYKILPRAWNKPRFCSFLVIASKLISAGQTPKDKIETYADRTSSSRSSLAPLPPRLPLPLSSFRRAPKPTDCVGGSFRLLFFVPFPSVMSRS